MSIENTFEHNKQFSSPFRMLIHYCCKTYISSELHAPVEIPRLWVQQYIQLAEPLYVP